MTLTEFKFLLQPNGLLDSPDRDVNISYTGSRIEAIAIRIANNNLIQLQQATTLVLKAPEAGTTLNISLENSQVPIRTVNREQVGNYYLYNFVEQDQQPVMTATPSPTGLLPSEEYFTEVIVLPSSAGGIFQGSEYDVLLNNSMNNRSSAYIQVSDRGENQVNPVNLPSILIDNAIPANIQDSNYSDTGWAGGRYNGTPTTKYTFGGIDPAITGKSFQGAYYSLSTENATIFGFADTDRAYIEYLHSGLTDYPTYGTYYTAFDVDAIVSTSSSIIPIEGNLGRTDPQIQPGDIIQIFNYQELIKVTNIIKLTKDTYNLEVIRGWNNTVPSAYNASGGDTISKILPTFVYELNRSKPATTRRGKLYIRESQELVYLDDFGQVVSSSMA